jgi:hypothetical protein
MSSKFYVDKVLYQNYFDIVQKIVSKEQMEVHLFLLSNKCITIKKEIKKILVPYYFYKYCSKNMNILKINYLKTKPRIFILVSYQNKFDHFYHLNLFCDTFNLLSPDQKNNSTPVKTYKNLLEKLRKNPNSGGYIIKSEYDNLPNNIKEKLYTIQIKRGKYPVILTLK